MTDNKSKRPLKTEPTFSVKLSDEQREVVKQFHDNDTTFVLGDFGSGKTLVACYIALSEFRKKKYNKIWITRPILKNNLGILPNGIAEKMHPYIYPILQNFEMCQGKQATEKMRAEGTIEIIPVDVAKGLTFMDSVVIVDEFMDMDYNDFRTIVTRVGKDSKIIFCGSFEQIDKSIDKKSCLHKVKVLENSGLTGWVNLKQNHRKESVRKLIDYIEKGG